MNPDPSLFATAARYCLILAGVLGLMTVVLWVRQVRWRFAFFGYTAFTLVLAAGLGALSLAPIVRTSIPGSVAFTTVFDNNSDRAAIAVSPRHYPPTTRPHPASGGGKSLCLRPVFPRNFHPDHSRPHDRSSRNWGFITHLFGSGAALDVSAGGSGNDSGDRSRRFSGITPLCPGSPGPY